MTLFVHRMPRQKMVRDKAHRRLHSKIARGKGKRKRCVLLCFTCTSSHPRFAACSLAHEIHSSHVQFEMELFIDSSVLCSALCCGQLARDVEGLKKVLLTLVGKGGDS